MEGTPQHYQGQGGMSCADLISGAIGKQNMQHFWRGNAMKYLYRAGKKGGGPDHFKIDVLKAIDCLQRLLEDLEQPTNH